MPFLPPEVNNTLTPQPQPQISSSAMQDSGTLTVKQVILGTDKLLPNSKFKITPNPFTLKGSLIIQDNNETIDSNLTNGIITLKNVKFSSYLLNETSSAGFGPVLLKTRITVHKTDPNPLVTIENRQLNLPFEGPATVTAPFLNDSSLRTFVANGATLGGTVPIKKVDQLPPGFLVSTEKRPAAVVVSNTTTNPVTFKTQIPSTASASQIYNSFKIPTYPAPVKDIASHIIYISPVFVIKQQDSDNNSFILTPIIAKIFPDMSLLLNHSSQVASGLAKVQDIKMKFAQNASDVGFSFGISDSIPAAFRVPKAPVDILALFMNIGYVGGRGAGEVKAVNFSNAKSFVSSPEATILVNKSLNMTKLADGCPDISLFSFNESTGNWQQIGKPIRVEMLDVHNECAYILRTEHFSKFAVGGPKPPTGSAQ